MTARRLAIIGDGKMGQAIRSLAIEKGWKVTALIGERESARGSGITAAALGNPEVAVEFSQPDAAVANITSTLRAGIPVVVGTTGWYESLADVTRVASQSGSAMLWSPNFSLGVNVMIELARYAGTLMRTLDDFDAHIVETHHTQKKDAPSGTALAIGKAASDALDRPIPITSVRAGAVPGTHELLFDGLFEQISLTHLARDRRVFAEGALKAADWLVGRKGVFTMRDVLELPQRK
ncbi:MAG TPA: dihydrodipicolinate reductase C-terminal domain-containing protein [Gemmatimonadaceae bacterium]|jgi:4-hydroxy-tetrahydrodipicolinate reductase|nr:dihydrodipicolinate reductase C-terminal domain-containing protein [Gemmatimonadaceae bacterium]